MKEIKNMLIVFAVTLVMGFIGMLIDSNIGFDGNFSVVMTIATIGSAIFYSINKKE